MVEQLKAEITKGGFRLQGTFDEVGTDSGVEVDIGCPSAGDREHGGGPSIAWFDPR